MIVRPEELDGLRHAVQQLAPEFIPRSVAPATFRQLVEAAQGRAIPVWSGASDKTIWGDVRTNHAFRAWHDAAHLVGRYPFTLAGEEAAWRTQVATLCFHYPQAPLLWGRLLWIEIVEQAYFHAEYGQFPADQIAFTMAKLEQW